MSDFLSELLFLRQRFTGSSVFDILLVALLFFIILQLFRGAQANTLVRGIIAAVIVLSITLVLTDLPAVNYVMSSLLPAIIVVIPVIFAPEIRRSFERIGRMQIFHSLFPNEEYYGKKMQEALGSIVLAAVRLSERKQGALIVMKNIDDLEQYEKTGVQMDAEITAELLLQIFYPNTPLHDGAVIISNGRIEAASCVMPLSSRDVLDESPERTMGLRHRAALGVAERTDAVVLVVSEETGAISIAMSGKIEHGVTPGYARNTLDSIYKMPEKVSVRRKILNKILSIRKKAGNS